WKRTSRSRKRGSQPGSAAVKDESSNGAPNIHNFRLLNRSRIPTKAFGSKQKASLEALFDFYVNAERAVLIAQAHDRDVPIHVVLHLNHLLLGRAYVRNVSDGEMAGALLLDGDARCGVLFRAGRTDFSGPGVHAEARDAKQPLQPTAQLAGNGFRENGGGAGRATWRSATAAVCRGFRRGLPKSQQSNDVIGGQRRVGAIREGELAGRTVEIQSDFILFDSSCRFHVQDGIEAERIGKVQISPGYEVPVAGEIQVTRKNMNMPEQDGMFPRSADTEISIGLEFRAGPFHAGIGRGERFHVELQITQV